MSWNSSLYTNSGADMVAELLGGRTLTISKATGGAGEASTADEQKAQTAVLEEKQTFKILALEDATDSSGEVIGKRIKIQITNETLTEGYVLHQVGIFAKLDDATDETLMIVMQDDRGIEIPSHADNADFEIELFAIMTVSNVANLKVEIDPNALATIEQLNTVKTTLEAEITTVQNNVDTVNTDLSGKITTVQSNVDTVKQTYLPLSGGTMTGTITDSNGKMFGFPDSAASHNAIYRGKYLGSSVTSEQWAAIKAGTFEDLYIGDYWSINGVDYLIAAFDYWLSSGDVECTTNHLLVVPRKSLYSYHMNETNTTEGGYVGSDMYKNGLTQAKQMLIAAFGESHILKHREFLVNAMTNGKPTGTDWYDSTVELMNENMVYGGRQFSPMPDGATDPWDACRNYTIDKSQLSLFRYGPWMICNRNLYYWLRDPVSAAKFAGCGGDGRSDCDIASDFGGVRPVAGLIG